MGRFTLNTPWLRSIFPPSELPREGPSIVSDDVQLTADYFGGGYAFREPQQWFSAAICTKPADDSPQTIDTMPIGQTVRIIRASIQRDSLGVQAVALQAQLNIYSPDLSFKVSISPIETLTPVGAGTSLSMMFNIGHPVLVPGGSILRVYFFRGDNADYKISFLSCAVPRGVMLIA